MITVPVAMATTVPEEDPIAATEGAPLLQVPADGVHVSVEVAPSHASVPVMLPVVLTVITLVA